MTLASAPNNLQYLREVLKAYTLQVGDTKSYDLYPLVEGKNSTNYLVVSSSQKYLLRVYHSLHSAQDENNIERILKILIYCSSAGVLVPSPIENDKGKLATAGIEQGQKNVYALFHFIEGKHYDGSLVQIRALGRATGELHLVLANCTLPSPVQDEWAYALLSPSEIADGRSLIPPEAVTMLLEEIRSARTLPRGTLQLTHGDLHDKNTLFTVEKRAGFLDFDFMAKRGRMRDVAFCAFRHAIINNDAPAMILQRIAFFIAGYREKNKLSNEERKLLPDFVKQEALHRISYILRHATTKNDRTWLSDLSKHLFHIQLIRKVFPEDWAGPL